MKLRTAARRASSRWPRSRLARALLLVALVAAAAFANTLSFGFIYDDYWTIVANRHLERPLGELVSAAWSGQSIAQGIPDATRPLMTWSSWLDRRCFGLNPAAYHLHSLVLYMAVCVAAYLLILGVTRRAYLALAAALLFAVSPLHAEVVAAVNYREDLLAGLGCMGVAAFFFWPWLRPGWGAGLAMAALWLGALLAKESALVLPLLLLALVLGRRVSRAAWSAVEPIAVVLVAVGLAWLNWRWGMQVQGDDIPRASYPSGWDAIARSARFAVAGTLTALAPLRARPEYDPQGPASALWFLALAGIGALVVMLALRRHTRAAAAAIAFALVAPLASSPLLAPINERADRYWFVASLGGALFGACLLHLLRRWSRKLSYACLALCAGSGLWASWAAAASWSSESSLWVAALRAAPESPRAWASLARLHRLAGQDELAARAVERALALRPGYVPALITQAYNELWSGQVTQARATLAAVRAAGGADSAAFTAVARCAQLTSVEANACIRRSVPEGMVMGDPEQLRAFTESVLSAREGH